MARGRMRKYSGINTRDHIQGMDAMSDEFDRMYHSMHNGERKRFRIGTVFAGLALLLLLAGGGYLIYKSFSSEGGVPQATAPASKSEVAKAEISVREALAQGQYDQASRESERNRLDVFSAWLHDTLSVTFLFNYDLPQPAPVKEGRLQLPDGTPFYVTIQPKERCYLYLLCRDSAAEWQQLYPDANLPNGANPLAPVLRSIPDSGRFTSSGGPGTETLYLSASRWRQQGLEKLIQNVLQASGREAPLLDYLSRQREAMQVYPGIVCKVYAFDHNL